MSANEDAFDNVQGPIHLALTVSLPQEVEEYPLPHTLTLPAIETIGDGTPGTVVFRDISPRSTNAEQLQNAIDELPMGMVGTAAL
jgi:hypothetical protein